MIPSPNILNITAGFAIIDANDKIELNMTGHDRGIQGKTPRPALMPIRGWLWLKPWLGFVLVLALALATSGCGNFIARRMMQAPNSYPRWLSPPARVELAFDAIFLTNFPPHYAEVGPPAARLRYRIIEPADYNFAVTSTNWMKRGRPYYHFTFRTKLSGPTNQWTAQPRGTVLLLHGYGVAQFAMSPWAFQLGQEGWRCVLVDLRGHGKSTGNRIYYGLQETRDLSQLLDQLARDGHLSSPVSALGDSFGAVLALRLKASDPRIEHVVAISPYAALSNAVLNIYHEYADWLPGWVPRQGLKRLPALLNVPPEELDTTSVLTRQPVAALFVAGGADKISPESEVRKLYTQSKTGSEIVVVPQASHEAVTYYFNGLVPPVLAWLRGEKIPQPIPPASSLVEPAPTEATAAIAAPN